MVKLKRRKSREKAIILLYQCDLLGKNPDSVLEAEKNFGNEIDVFTIKLAKGVTENKIEIDSIIKDTVKNWELDRIAIIDRNIIRVAIYEMIYEEDIPLKVSVDEAIEIAKTIGQKDDTPKFVNGILGKIFQKMEKIPEEDII